MAQPSKSPTLIDSSPAAAHNPNGSRSSSFVQPLSGNTTTTYDNPIQPNRGSIEEEDLAQAIRLSLVDQAKTMKEGRTSSGPSCQRQSLSGRSMELILSLNNEFDTLDDPDGDTAIYFGAPPQMPEQTDKTYQYVKNHFDRVHVVHWRTLRLMGDESKFTDRDLLNPTKSFRAERRLRKLGVLDKAEAEHGGKFKYYIDLRPPREDEEAVILITELTSTRGVLTWHLAESKYDLAPLAVLGHDEFGIQLPVQALPQQANASTSTDDKTTQANTSAPATNAQPLNNSPTSPVSLPQPKIAPEYCPIRHWSAIERLLQAIQGNDPKLDSAPKVWTFFAIARYFGCAAHERISGWITTWLYTGNNVNFIQNNPEVAYRIAMGIRSPDLVKDSFSLLVGERALIEAYGEYRSEILNPLRRNVHGRKLEHLDDDERNRIDHAASSLVKRIRGSVHSLCRSLDFLRESASYNMLDAIDGENPEEIKLLSSAKDTIKEYVRSRIYHVLCQDQKPLDDLEQDLASTLPFRPATSESYCDVYKSLNQPMRLFTKSFWLALQRTQFDVGHLNIANQGTIGLHYETRYIKGLKGLYKDDPINGITGISRSTFNNKISAVNQMLYNREAMKGKGKERCNGYLSGTSQAINYDSVALPLESLTIRSPTRSSESRPEPEFQPAKRRKTNDSDDFADVLRDGITLKSSLDATNSVRPSWRSTDGLLPKEPQTTTALSSDEPAFAPRPKVKIMKDMSSRITGYMQSAWGRRQDNPGSQLNPSSTTASHMHDISKSGSKPTATSEKHVLSQPPKLAPYSSEEAALPSNSNKYFNSSTGNWDQWGVPIDSAQEERVRPVPDTQQRPLESTSGNRIKQAFSNSNTDNYNIDFSENNSHPINPGSMLYEIGTAISNISSSILYPPHLFHHTVLLPTNLFDTLLCLEANEFRYLPLWVPDGNDDGSGGVFDETPVPNLDAASAGIESFGPGRIRRPYDQADSEMSGSDIEEIGSSQAVSTVGKASKLATDGTETVKSLSSNTSSASGGPDAETVIVTLDDSASDALSVIRVGEDATGTDGNTMNDQDNLDFNDDDTDTDTINGDDPLEKAMSASLKAFINSSNDENGYADSHSENEEEQATSLSGFSALSEVVNHALSSTEDKDKDKGKGKAKAQNFPHDVPDLLDFRDLDLPYRDRNAQPAPTAQAGERSTKLPPAAFVEDAIDDEDYEFL